MSRLHSETFLWPLGGALERAPKGTRAIVVGGGIAGASAATLLAERGVQVTLLEKEAYLGGRVGAWTEGLPWGERFQMERGFHAFFRQYYNLRAWLGRFDPTLSLLAPLEDYPVLGPDGAVQGFRSLPKTPPFQVAALVLRTPYLKTSDLFKIKKRAALEMLSFDMQRTYERLDQQSAHDYLDSLCFPPEARRMLFDVFSHSFFMLESEMSAAELLMMFHFYFTGNPEGLLFDVMRRPFSFLWDGFARWLSARGSTIKRSTSAQRVERDGANWRVVEEGGSTSAELLILALPVSALQRLVEASPALDDFSFREKVRSLSLTRPFAVWRLWLDRPLRYERAPFVGTAGLGLLDNISLYHKLEDESEDWARRNQGAIVELHSYALPSGLEEDSIKKSLRAGLEQLYPETRGAKILHERYLLRSDCPGFPPGSHRLRPTVQTPFQGVALCGDFIKLPFPAALMERAAASGFLAANALLSPLGVRPEPVKTVPQRGLFAPLFVRQRPYA